MGVVAAQIVEDNRHDRCLGVQPQLKVAGAMDCDPVLPCDMTVITDGVPGQILQANMTGCGRVVGLSVLRGHLHGFRVGQHALNFALLFLQCL